MRLYETVYILNPTLEAEQQQALIDRLNGVVQNNGGEVEHLERWDRRRLAYEIQGQREGDYIVMNFRGTPGTETELDRIFRITDGILRHLIVRMDERLAERKLAEAKAAQEARDRARTEAEARAAEAAEAEARAAEAQAAEAQAARAQAAEAQAAEANEAPPAQEETGPAEGEGEGNQAETAASEA